jgi:glutathionylspermidine synthase
MRRLSVTPRADAEQKLDAIGLAWAYESDCWNESFCYEFTEAQIIEIETATNELHAMCLQAARYIVDHKLYRSLGIREDAVPLIERSWNSKDPSLYGRFDLLYNGVDPPKMLEYNADTPTALVEASVAQWQWLADLYPHADQFNSLHESLVDRWKQIAPSLPQGRVDFCSLDNFEDGVTAGYLLETARQAGLAVNTYPVAEIGRTRNGFFVDPANQPITAMFKLYPWEWMVREEFGKHLFPSTTKWIEPPWKMLLSNKGILAILWKLFPNSPYLVEARLDAPPFHFGWVRKPLLSREGGNISVHGGPPTEGPYGVEGFVWQRFVEPPVFDGRYPVVGSWIVGGAAHGMGIRESTTPVTDNRSPFIPHYFI